MRAAAVASVFLLVGCLAAPLDDAPGTVAACPDCPETPVPSLSPNANWTHKEGSSTTRTERLPDDGSTIRLRAVTRTPDDGQTWTTTVESLLRAEDWALVETRESTRIDSGYQHSTYPDIVTQYEPPCVELRWPLKVGAHWTSTCTSQESGIIVGYPHNQTTRLEYTVEAYEEVVVPAGTLEAYRILVQTPGRPATTYRWWAPEACAWARESRGPDPSENVTLELTSYHC
jgi:hypothetical protein